MVKHGLSVALLLSMGLMGTAATLSAQQRDENGQIVNPQPHTKKQLKEEEKQEKHQLKHNQKADKAATKANREDTKAAGERAKADDEAQKANTPKQ